MAASVYQDIKGNLRELGVRMTECGNVWRDENWMTGVPGVFTTGGM